jgi:hypothetical protein
MSDMVIVEKGRKRPSLWWIIHILTIAIILSAVYPVLIGERSFILDILTLLACFANALDILVTYEIVVRLPKIAASEINWLAKALWKRFGIRRRTLVIDLAISMPLVILFMGVLPTGEWWQRWYAVPLLLSPIPLNLLTYLYERRKKAKAP